MLGWVGGEGWEGTYFDNANAFMPEYDVFVEYMLQGY
jgi:hypothetical protein